MERSPGRIRAAFVGRVLLYRSSLPDFAGEGDRNPPAGRPAPMGTACDVSPLTIAQRSDHLAIEIAAGGN
jgi:hypothetical protein